MSAKIHRCANRDIPLFANRYENAEGYGNMSTQTYRGTRGFLPRRLASIYWNKNNINRTVFSYSTPIAWFDSEFNAWFIPVVSYSVTTAKHQGYLWRLNGTRHFIPADISLEEYIRVGQGKMIFTGNGTIPGPNYNHVTHN